MYHKDKYCDFSKGLEEKNLQAAICRAISRVLQGREDGYELLKSKLIYATSDVDTDELYLVEKGIHDEQVRIEELADLAIQSKCNKDKYTDAIADCSQRIKDLRERRDMLMTQISSSLKTYFALYLPLHEMVLSDLLRNALRRAYSAIVALKISRGIMAG